MKKIFKAVYVHGVLKPKGKLSLPKNKELGLVVTIPDVFAEVKKELADSDLETFVSKADVAVWK